MAYSRDLVIVYGAYTINTANVRDIDGHLILDRSHDAGAVEFSFVVYGTTDALFKAEIAAAEVAFRKPYQDLTITQGSETFLDAKQSTGTAHDCQPSILKREDKADTGRSRRYTVRIEYGLPASTGAEPVSGLRDVSVDVSLNPAGVATVTFSGTFTAVGTDSARTVYSAQIGGYVTTIMSSLSISNYELSGVPSSRQDTNNKTLEFTRTYDELIFSQAGSSLNDSSIVKQRLNITRNRSAPGDYPEAERLALLSLSYDAWIAKSVSTNLRSKFTSIRAWLITQIQNTLDGGEFAVTSETPNYHYDENRISVSMEVQGQAGSQSVIEQRVTVEDDDSAGWEVVPAHTGDPLSAYWFQGPRIVVRTVTHILRKIGSFTEQDAASFAGAEVSTAKGRDPAGGGGGEWLIMRSRPNASQLRMGIDSDTMDITEMSVTTQMRYVKKIAPGTPSGGGGGVITPSPVITP